MHVDPVKGTDGSLKVQKSINEAAAQHKKRKAEEIKERHKKTTEHKKLAEIQNKYVFLLNKGYNQSF